MTIKPNKPDPQKKEAAQDWSSIGRACMERFDFKGAEAAYRIGIQSARTTREKAIFLQNLGAVQLKLRDDAEALDSLRKAWDMNARYPTLHSNLAVAYQRAGRYDEAGTLLRDARIRWPDDPGIANNYATFLMRQGQLGKAKEILIAMSSKAAHELDIRLSLAKVYADEGNKTEAQRQVATALTHHPHHPNALWAAAKLLMEKGEYKSAWEYIERIPDDLVTSEIKAGIPLLRMCHQLDSGYEDETDMHRQYNAFLLKLDDFEKAWSQPNGQEWLAVGLSQPFHLAYHESNVAHHLRRYGQLCCDAMKNRFGERLPRRGSRSRIRVGIVSGHFHRHSVWDVITSGIVKHLDRSRFELIGYASEYTPDDVSLHAERLFDTFHRGPRDVETWIRQIQEDAPDILLYPEVGMKPVSSALAATRLAPVQFVTWGHPSTSGFPTLDYYLSAELLEPEHAQTHYSERLVKLPGLGVTIEPIAIPEEELDLAELALPDDCPLVLCPQTPFKLTPAHDTLLLRLAKQTGRCKFIFFKYDRWPTAYAQMEERLKKTFSNSGLDSSEYCVFLPWLDRARFYGLLRKATLALDAPAFSGFTTAMQLFQFGLPMVTLEGEFMRQRLASGILRQIGLTELIAHNSDEYISIAHGILTDSVRQERLGADLREGMTRIFGNVAPIRALEQVMISTLQERTGIFRSSEPPAVSVNESLPHRPPSPWETLGELDNNHWQKLRQDYAPTGLLDMLDISPERSLDVGCFVGATSALLKQRYPHCITVGIEPSVLAAERARSRMDTVHLGLLEEIDLQSAGYGPGHFDVIVLADVLEHMYNPYRALRLLRPLLSPGGCLLASIPNSRNLFMLGQLAEGRWQYENSGLLDITHIRFFTLFEIREMFKATGYRIELLSHHPDVRWTNVMESRSTLTTLKHGRITLTDLTPQDVAELATLQFYIRARPTPA